MAGCCLDWRLLSLTCVMLMRCGNRSSTLGRSSHGRGRYRDGTMTATATTPDASATDQSDSAGTLSLVS